MGYEQKSAKTFDSYLDDSHRTVIAALKSRCKQILLWLFPNTEGVKSLQIIGIMLADSESSLVVL